MMSTKHPIIYNIDEHRLSTLVFVFFHPGYYHFPLKGVFYTSFVKSTMLAPVI